MAILPSKKVKVAAQIEAESDKYLFECFHDNGVIEKLLDNRFQLIAGRKGTGKTAIARYLQKFHDDYGVDYAVRLTLSDLQGSIDGKVVDGEILLKFLMIKTAQLLKKENLLNEDGQKFWNDYFEDHGLQDVPSYREWVIKAKQLLEKKSAGIGFEKIAGAGLSSDKSTSYEKQLVNDATSTLADRLAESIKDKAEIIIIVDDITDQLDYPGTTDVKESLSQIKYVLNQLHYYNAKFLDESVNITFVCTIRDDLWDFILGSNENKLIHNCLWLEWTEKDFCELIIKRLPFFADKLEDSADDPYNAIKQMFPDEVFNEMLDVKKIKQSEIKHYETKFYAYVQLISFNRPRDFLRLVHAMKNRLSEVKPVELKHIKASELEYTTYFYNELRDELSIFAKILGLEATSLMALMAKLAEKSKLPYSELKAILASSFKASHSKTYRFISILWAYSLVGIIKDKGYAQFKHNQLRTNGFDLPSEDSLKSYSFMLHRGLYWKFNREQDD